MVGIEPMHIHQATAHNCTPEHWDALVASDPQGHLLQTWEWAELKALAGWQVERWYVEDGGQVMCGAQVLYQHRGPLQFAYLPKGPFIAQDNPAALELLWNKLHQRNRRRLAISLKLEPEKENSDAEAIRWLEENSFIPSSITIQPRRTIIIDLLATESQILARMKPKWRYNIGLSERRGVQVREGSIQEIPLFYDLMRITGERDCFGIHNLAYYQRAYELFVRAGRVVLLLAEYENEILAGIMVFAFNGQSWYLYGASGNHHRELMVNHQLQWRAMQWAKSKGCRQYDLWGIANSETEPADQLRGVSQFKSGFGGRVVEYVGAYDRIYCRPAYLIWETYWRSRKAAASSSGTAVG